MQHCDLSYFLVGSTFGTGSHAFDEVIHAHAVQVSGWLRRSTTAQVQELFISLQAGQRNTQNHSCTFKIIFSLYLCTVTHFRQPSWASALESARAFFTAKYAA
jgi:hypothetical protein